MKYQKVPLGIMKGKQDFHSPKEVLFNFLCLQHWPVCSRNIFSSLFLRRTIFPTFPQLSSLEINILHLDSLLYFQHNSLSRFFSTLRCLENKETRLEKFVNVCSSSREASCFFFPFCSFSSKISHFFLKGQFLPLPLTKQVLKVSSTSANARFFFVCVVVETGE